jgi:hypothetical protein
VNDSKRRVTTLAPVEINDAERPASVRVASDPAEPSLAWAMKAAFGSDEQKRRMSVYQDWSEAQEKAVKAREEEAKVYQIVLFPDDKRAMPTDFVACALFAAVQTQGTTRYRGEQIASINGYKITLTGNRLTQVHADVLMGIAALARDEPQGHIARFSYRMFLRFLGRELGSNSRDSLRQLLDDLTGTVIRITDPSGNESIAGPVLGPTADSGQEDEAEFAVVITRDLCRMFERGFALIDWQQRLQLKRKPLALWLQLYFSQFHRPVEVRELLRLCGSSDELRFFRRRLKRELETLEKVGAIQQFYIDEKDVVHIAPVGKPLPARFKPKKELPPPVDVHPNQPALFPTDLPQVSERGRKQFEQEFPEKDFDTCLAAWQAWHGSKQARYPDAAFRGFVRKMDK